MDREAWRATDPVHGVIKSWDMMERLSSAQHTRWLKLKRQKISSIRKDVERLEPSSIIDRITKWVQPLWKTIQQVLKALNVV